jgi:CO/xanthine dehydrogenase Mo-binding subunit
MEEFMHIGKRIPKVDAVKKATGAADFTDDIPLPGMLYGAVKRSPHAHAKIISIETSKAKALGGVVAVITADDLPEAKYGLSGAFDYVILARERVLYVGDPVALVAAEDEPTAKEAVDLIEVQYEELPALFDTEEAWKPDCPVELHPDFYEHRVVMPGGCSIDLMKEQNKKNLCGYFRIRTGDLEEAFKEADLIIENRYTTQWMTPSPLEPDVAIAKAEPDGDVTIWGSNQCPYMVRTELSDAVQIPVSKLRLIVPYVGGGFGHKLELKAEAMATALALHTGGRPVKVKWSKEETFTFTSHPSVIYVKDGFKKDGTLIAREISYILESGGYGGWTNIKVKNSAFATIGIYKTPNMRLDAYGVYTNKPVTACQRGFGARQPIFAIENQMDIAAEKLGIDPFELRLNNCLEEGDINASGETMESVGIKDCLLKVRKAIEAWGPLERGSDSKRRGRGIAVGNKYSLVPISACAIVKVHEDETVEVRTSAVDMGQGAYTVMAETAAEEFKIPMDRVKLARVDTAITPFGFGASSNTQTQITGNALRLACEDVKKQIFEKAAEFLDVKPEGLDTRDSKVFVKKDPESSIRIKELFTYMPLAGMFLEKGGEFIGKATAYRTGTVAQTDPNTGHTTKMANYWGYSCQGVEVEVDIETGHVKVTRMVNATDCGNPPGVEGQIEGCFSIGLGQGLLEEMVFDENGRHTNATFRDYKLPSITDHPTFEKSESIIVECAHEPDRMWGAKGAAEAPITPVVAAIGNAVHDAIGVRIYDAPITHQKILKALGKIE